MLPIVIVAAVPPRAEAVWAGPEPWPLPDCCEPPLPPEPRPPEPGPVDPPGTTAEPPGAADADGPPGAAPWPSVPSDCCCAAVKAESGRRVPQAVSASTSTAAAPA